MTVCVPKKPFLILGKTIFNILKYSGLITVPLSFFVFQNDPQNFIWVILMLPILLILFGVDDIYNKVKDKNLIKWCDEK
jgi:hypothetical protein